MVLLSCLLAFLAQAKPSLPEERALDYLAREVPLWSRQNHCFSCHNNGDGARALYAARRMGYRVPDEALVDTTAWLARPREWDANRGDPGFSDKKLARLQFAFSMLEASRAGAIGAPDAFLSAAESLLPYQDADGSWQVDVDASLGSPATWGTQLATVVARRILRQAGSVRFKAAIARAEKWLGARDPRSTLDAAALVLAFGSDARAALDRLLRGQTADGGWGPFAGTPPEAFDTAIALLALAEIGDAGLRDRVERGRRYLMRAQLPSGGWTETTRPAGARSYAQHVSTSGWATLALLETSADAKR